MDHNGPAEQLNQFFGRSKKNFQNFFYYIKFEKKNCQEGQKFSKSEGGASHEN